MLEPAETMRDEKTLTDEHMRGVLECMKKKKMNDELNHHDLGFQLF